MKHTPPSADIIFVKTDRFFIKLLRHFHFITIPEWINMIVDSSKSFEELEHNFSSGAQKDIKKTIKYGYSYELTDDQKKMEFFYHRMFLPYILERYGEEMPDYYLKYIHMILQRNTMKLILVKDKETYISGGLVDIKGKKEFLPSMGILDGDIQYVKKYAPSALFYFHIVSAKKRDATSINYGNTRSFLNDGNYQFKRKWGMSVALSRFRWGLFGLNVLRKNNAVSNFLAGNPFIFVEHEQLNGFFYVHKDQPATLTNLQNICRTYYTPGIVELIIVSPKGFTQQAKENELFVDASRHNFVKSFSSVRLLNQNIEACVIRPRESTFESFSIQ